MYAEGTPQTAKGCANRTTFERLGAPVSLHTPFTYTQGTSRISSHAKLTSGADLDIHEHDDDFRRDGDCIAHSGSHQPSQAQITAETHLY